jgi:hypothetical protein
MVAVVEIGFVLLLLLLLTASSPLHLMQLFTNTRLRNANGQYRRTRLQ